MKLFKLIMNIVSKEGVLHFKRWQILQTRWFGIYLHAVYQPDKDRHLHDHPWDYISIPLWGEFLEKKRNIHNGKVYYSFRIVRPIQFIKRKAEEFHKIEQLNSKVFYSLFITGKWRRDWGYDVDGTWYTWQEYHKIKKTLP